jgi:hypothetical protein
MSSKKSAQRAESARRRRARPQRVASDTTPAPPYVDAATGISVPHDPAVCDACDHQFHLLQGAQRYPFDEQVRRREQAEAAQVVAARVEMFRSRFWEWMRTSAPDTRRP